MSSMAACTNGAFQMLPHDLEPQSHECRMVLVLFVWRLGVGLFSMPLLLCGPGFRTWRAHGQDLFHGPCSHSEYTTPSLLAPACAALLSWHCCHLLACQVKSQQVSKQSIALPHYCSHLGENEKWANKQAAVVNRRRGAGACLGCGPLADT